MRLTIKGDLQSKAANNRVNTVSRKQFKIAKNTWIAQNILKAFKRQNKLYFKYLKSKKKSDNQIYRTFKNKVTRMKKSS